MKESNFVKLIKINRRYMYLPIAGTSGFFFFKSELLLSVINNYLIISENKPKLNRNKIN